MVPLLIIFGIAALLEACGGEEEPPAPTRSRPEHLPDGAPPVDEDEEEPDQDSLVQQAQEQVGSSFDVYVQASEGDREGCGLIRVEDLGFTPNDDGRSVLLSGTARWAAYPPSFPGDWQVESETAYRAGDFPIGWFAEDYPEYGTLGLSYMVTGTYDVEGQRLRMMVRNIDAETGEVSNVFLTPVYESWTDEEGETVTCQAQDDFGNEFFVEATAAEVEIPLTGGSGNGLLCQPCDSPIDRILFEVP